MLVCKSVTDEGPSDKQKMELCYDSKNAAIVKVYQVILQHSISYLIPENDDTSFSQLLSVLAPKVSFLVLLWLSMLYSMQ